MDVRTMYPKRKNRTRFFPLFLFHLCFCRLLLVNHCVVNVTDLQFACHPSNPPHIKASIPSPFSNPNSHLPFPSCWHVANSNNYNNNQSCHCYCYMQQPQEKGAGRQEERGSGGCELGKVRGLIATLALIIMSLPSSSAPQMSGSFALPLP